MKNVNNHVHNIYYTNLNHGTGGKVRFRDGERVAYRGEKYIVEKNPADDYDGGSRGKVKTKGKRGPGWV